MEYKRLTTKLEGKNVLRFTTKEKLEIKDYDFTGDQIDRLAELEDKIENGELIFSKDCSKCKYENNLATQYPCSHCCYCYTGKFEPKGAGNG